MKRLMVTGAGGPASINFIMSLRISPEKMHIVGTDTNKFRIHLAPTDSKFLVPKATDEDYIDALNEIVRKEKVEFIHPQPDIEVRILSENREKLEANTFLPSNCLLYTSPSPRDRG